MRFENGQQNNIRLNDYRGQIVALGYESQRRMPTSWTDEETGKVVHSENTAVRARLAVYMPETGRAQVVGTTLVFPTVLRDALIEQGPGGGIIGTLVEQQSSRHADRAYLMLEALEDSTAPEILAAFEAAWSGSAQPSSPVAASSPTPASNGGVF